MIHRTFNLDSFARVLADDASHKVGPHVALSLFFNTFASLHPFPEIPPSSDLIGNLPKIIADYPAANCLVQYLCTSDIEQRESNFNVVIDHLLCAIRPFASRVPQQDQTKVVLRMHPYLKSPNVVNPTWPFLCFAILLTWQSADATHMLICHDIIRILEDLSRPFHDRPMCLLYLSLLMTMSVHQDLGHCALKKNLEGWLAGKPRRKSSATSERRPGSSGSQSHATNSMRSEALSERVPAFPSNQALELETGSRGTDLPLHTHLACLIYCSVSRSSYSRHLLADALAFAHRAVELDSQLYARDAVDAYAKSAELLVEAMRLRSQGGRISRSARRMNDFVRIRFARLCEQC